MAPNSMQQALNPLDTKGAKNGGANDPDYYRRGSEAPAEMSELIRQKIAKVSAVVVCNIYILYYGDSVP